MTKFEIWTIIISAVSTVVTFSAVIVALRQNKLQWKKRIYLTFNNNLGSCVKGTNHTEFLELSVFNGGNTKVAISNIYLNRKITFALPIDREEQLFQKPEILDIGETASFRIDFNSFISAINHLIKKREIKTDKPISIIVEELSGKYFSLKIKHTPAEYLLWNNGEMCLLPNIE